MLNNRAMRKLPYWIMACAFIMIGLSSTVAQTPVATCDACKAFFCCGGVVTECTYINCTGETEMCWKDPEAPTNCFEVGEG